MFANDPNIRSAGQVCDYSKDQINEIIKCQQDIIYFGQEYFYIVTIDDGLKKIPMREYQKKILKNLVHPQDGKRHSIVLQPRQSGKCVYDGKILIRNKIDSSVKEILAKDFFKSVKQESGF